MSSVSSAPPATAAPAPAATSSTPRLDIEDWYEPLKSLTFASVFIPFTYRHATALVKAMDAAKLKSQQKPTAAAAAAAGTTTSDAADAKWSGELQSLEATIDAALTSHGWNAAETGCGAFVRLSKRSPKDGSLRHPNFKAAIAERLPKPTADAKDSSVAVAAASAGKWSDRDVLLAMTQATTALCRVRTGADALTLLVRSTRVYHDLSLMLLSCDDETKWKPLNLILRAFAPLRPEMEFRAFVFCGALTAISQYNSLFCVPEIVRDRDAIAATIQRYVNDKILPLVAAHNKAARDAPPPPTTAAEATAAMNAVPLHLRGCNPEHMAMHFSSSSSASAAPKKPPVAAPGSLPLSFIIDFGYTESGELKLIELNPFHTATHACLFDWKTERHILEGARAPTVTATAASATTAAVSVVPFRIAEGGAQAQLSPDAQLSQYRKLTPELRAIYTEFTGFTPPAPAAATAASAKPASSSAGSAASSGGGCIVM